MTQLFRRKQRQRRNGYPCSYKSVARVILPIIADGIPSGKNPLVIGDDYIMPKNWSSDIEVNKAKIAECAPEDSLLIEAWDLS